MAADLNSQAFWNDFMRRPEAKAAYQAERKLQEKKQMWLDERQELEAQGAQRKCVADALEAAPADMKKLIAPMFHIRVVQRFLWMLYDECQKTATPFQEKLRDEQTVAHLRKMRDNFQEGGEERMAELEKQWYSICNDIATEQEEAREKEQKPVNIDIHTLKHVLEFAQECKREGNSKFREGLYEEALRIYSQGDDMMRKWKVDKHLKNESKWLQEYHIACLKNKAQAALKLEKWTTALEAVEAALEIDKDDHKAWYRKALAEKGMGRFGDAEDSLTKLEDVAQHCPDRRSILKDCESERQRIRAARAKHSQQTKDMLGKAFQAGIFSGDREKEVEDDASARRHAVADGEPRPKPVEAPKPLERNVQLTERMAGELIDELAEAYGAKWFQERVQKCARDSGFERSVFLRRLRSVAFEVQRPVLEKWGFEGSEHGVREMTAAIRDHAGKDGKPTSEWLREKQERCLELLYGGREGGMAALLS